MKLLDCTLRDGGYYNSWNFPVDIVHEYLNAMSASGVDVVELGLRSLKNSGFKGASAYTTDEYLNSMPISEQLEVAVMVNASELVGEQPLEDCLLKLFPQTMSNSPVDIVRIACHVHEFEKALPAATWLKSKGYKVGFNLMQVADRTEDEVSALAMAAAKYDLDVLYFADSMGSMTPEHCTKIIRLLKRYWKGALGIHTHDNMGLALQNTMAAFNEGVTWLDSTVTGMGRGPGNSRTEELVIEAADRRNSQVNLIPLMSIIRRYFQPLKNEYGWGSNPYYYLSGKYGIHPTYVQEMLSDPRYGEEDILAVIEHLRTVGGKKFDQTALGVARQFYFDKHDGAWSPSDTFKDRAVLLLGSGPGVSEHKVALENYIAKERPLVLALNTQTSVKAEMIDFRLACHPVRLLADCERHTQLPQPLITPLSALPLEVQKSLSSKEIFDFGLNVEDGKFEFGKTCCTLPNSLVIAYALAVATSGQAKHILMAGFDGYGADDPRSQEMNGLLELYQNSEKSIPLTAITPTRYGMHSESVYAL